MVVNVQGRVIGVGLTVFVVIDIVTFGANASIPRFPHFFMLFQGFQNVGAEVDVLNAVNFLFVAQAVQHPSHVQGFGGGNQIINVDEMKIVPSLHKDVHPVFVGIDGVSHSKLRRHIGISEILAQRPARMLCGQHGLELFLSRKIIAVVVKGNIHFLIVGEIIILEI